MIVILPIIIWIGSAITGIMSIGIIASFDASALVTTVSQIKDCFVSFTILTVIQNILTTCLLLIHAFQLLILLTALIVYRIWTIDRALPKKNSSRLPFRRILRIIIESGMIYTVSVLLSLGFLFSGSNVVYITGRMVC